MEHQPSELSSEELRREQLGAHENVNLIDVVPVRVAIQGWPSTQLWEGVVHVFETAGLKGWKGDQAILDEPGIVYVWSSIVGNTNRRRFYAVPRQDSASTAEEAVRQAMSRAGVCSYWHHDLNT
jgi:hypothetical protein